MRSLRRCSWFCTCAQAESIASFMLTIWLYPQPLSAIASSAKPIIRRIVASSPENRDQWPVIRNRTGLRPFSHQLLPAPPPPNTPPPNPPKPPPPPPNPPKDRENT